MSIGANIINTVCSPRSLPTLFQKSALSLLQMIKKVARLRSVCMYKQGGINSGVIPKYSCVATINQWHSCLPPLHLADDEGDVESPLHSPFASK